MIDIVFSVVSVSHMFDHYIRISILWVWYFLIICSILINSDYMMTSSNGNTFRVTGHVCGEFTGYRWINGTKARGLMFSLICAWINGWVNKSEAGDLRRHCAHYDVSVMRRSNYKLKLFMWLIEMQSIINACYQVKANRSPTRSTHGWLGINAIQGTRELRSGSIQLQKLQLQRVIHGNPKYTSWHLMVPKHVCLF